VFFDPVSLRFEFFGKRCNDAIVSKWQKGGNKQVICQAELIAIPIALATWQSELKDRDLILFIDNDPAREALIRGSSVSPTSSEYVHWCRMLCAGLAISPWYARVASPSNIADAPSRGRFEQLHSLGACWRDPAPISCEPDLQLLDF
jgi:hypothetical protein